ncbi:YfhO family protein [Eggerthellaceae bacterium 24-137]
MVSPGYLLGLLALCAAAFGVVGTFNAVTGRSLIWVPDGVALYLNFFIREGEILRDLLASAGQPDFAAPLYTFDGGYGTDLLALMAGCLNDPFNLVSVFVSPEQSEYVFEALIFVRFYLAAVAFALYSLSRGNGRWPSLCGALCYVFGGFVLFWGVLRHPNFINEAILLPLLFWGADRVFERKSPTLLIVAMALQFVFSVYFSYMMLIILVAYCLLKYFFTRKGRSLRDFAGLFGRFVLYIGCAALVAGIFVVPIVLMLTSMGRVGIEREIPLFDNFWYYWRYASTLVGAAMSNRGLSLGIVPVAGVLLLIVAGKAIDWHARVPWLIGLGVCFIGSLLPHFGSMMNGFGYPTDRWAVAYAFCASYAVVLVIPALRSFSGRQWVAFGAGAVLFAALVVLFALVEDYPPSAVMAALFVIVSVIAVVAGRNCSPRAVSGVLVSLAIAGAACSVPIMGGELGAGDNLGVYQERDNSYSAMNTIPLDRASSAIDDDYRIDRREVYGARNQSFAQGFMGADFYSSFYNQNVDDFRQALGIADNYSNYIFNGHDGRFALESLMGARYFVSASEARGAVPEGYEKVADLGEGDGGALYSLYENSSAMPLAFVYETAVSEDDFQRLGMVQREELLTRACVIEGLPSGADEGAGVLAPSGVVDQEVSLESAEGALFSDGVIRVYEPGGKIVVKAGGVGKAENFLVFDNLEFEAMPLEERADLVDKVGSFASTSETPEYTVWDELKWAPASSSNLTLEAAGVHRVATIVNSGHTGYGGKTDWAFNMGYSRKPVREFSVEFSTCGTYSFDSLYVASLPLEGVSSALDKLQEDNAAVLELDTNAMTVHVEAEPEASDDARYVFLSIPYSRGWAATLDGQPVEIQKANVGFMAIAVDGRAHNIHLEYCPPGLKVGAGCTVVGIVLFVGLAVGRALRIRRRKGVLSDGFAS